MKMSTTAKIKRRSNVTSIKQRQKENKMDSQIVTYDCPQSHLADTLAFEGRQ